MFLAWTTVQNAADASRLAGEVVTLGLATCVQIDGPIRSVYRWQGQIEWSEEFRLCFKFLPDKLSELEQHVLAAHPYEIPEWMVVRTERVGEKYLSWAGAKPTDGSP